MSSKKYNSMYRAIVISNSDPEKRGRVKVFVPHLSATIYEKWNETFKKESDSQDKNFVFLDKEKNPDLNKILPYLKKTLPWAEICSPNFGGDASGRYNAYTEKGSTSDSNYWEGNTQVEGFRPLQNYARDNRISDAFGETGKTRNSILNPNANQYTPSDYSNLSRGVFSIPNVGSHVWVFFEGGDLNYPVVFGAMHGMEDWQRIYTMQKSSDSDNEYFVSPDYPGSYENLSKDEKPSIDHNIKTFRAKHVINTNKHSLEMVDTDLSEIIKLTHYSGSFLEFNNNTTTRLSTNNDQSMILGDQFLTVKHNQSTYIANHQENIIDGDRISKIGDFDKRRQIVLEIQSILRDTHKYKRLFEIQRTGAHEPYTSPLQEKSGSPASCPVCKGSGNKLGSICATCEGRGQSPSSQDGQWNVDPAKNELNDILISNQKKLLEYEAKFGNGGDDISLITGSKVTTIGTSFNGLESFRVDKAGKIRDDGVWIGKDGTYVTMAPMPLVEYVDVDSIPGGDWDITVGNKYSLNVGSKGVRIITTGPLDMCGTIMNISAESLNLVGKHECLIQSDRRVEIRGDVINLHPFKAQKSTILIDGKCGIRSNLSVVGGAHIEGEFSFIHATAPKKTYVTSVGYGPIAHTHTFEAPPWSLLDSASKVRESQQALNYPLPVSNRYSPGFWVPS